MRRVPLPSSNPRPGAISYFTVEMAQRGGETLLNSLFELKHKGAVAMAYQAFEGVCRAFLAHGEQNAVLGGLPARWADRLLERLERSEQHFILRRSSGFAFSFVAILRAEPRNSAAVILPKEHHSLWRARVHALNILKLICQDGVLAEDVARYVVDMFELAVRGFDCGSWAVRNSSMMLFAAATQRAIGDKRIADGGTRQQVASDDVFSRFQQLRGFLARELSKLLATDSKSSGALGGAAPPGLYPLLLFLSRLRPGDEDDQRVAEASASPCEDGSGLASFVPLVVKCASQPTMAIRHMAAKVVAAIVSDADAASVLSTLCDKLPHGIRNAKEHADVKGFSHNYVHGVLTQIRHLTTKYLFVGDDQRKATPILKDSQAEFFDIVVTKFKPKLSSSSSSDAILTQCGSAFVFQTGHLDLLLQKMLVSNVLQIRKKAVKQFSNKLAIADLDPDAVTGLQALLIDQFLVETHPKVRARELQLLQSTSSADAALYQILCQEIEERSDENQPLILRQAAASALHHSGLLLLHTTQGADATSVDLALAGWLSALRLLQDDDVRVRSSGRHAVQKALGTTASSPGDSVSDATVLPLAVEYITASFARTGHGAAHLSKVLFELVDAPTVLAAYTGAAGAKAQDWDDLCRRIFESESSNYFAEREILAQNIVYSLLARSTEDGESMRLLRMQVLTAVAAALTTLNQEARREAGGQWLGGITYYSDVFAPLFGLLSAGVAV
ncbi:hypothetical protein PRIC1_008059 [Phytophthora ramorum]